MAEPTIDDYVEQTMAYIRTVADQALYHGQKLQSFLELIEDELLEWRSSV